MLAKAHITVGMAAAFTIMRPESAAEALPVIAGGALGCLICDLDCEIKAEKSDSSKWRRVMLAVAAAALFEDHLLDAGMWNSLIQNGSYRWFIGLAGFVLTCAFASASNHRGFSHSLPALMLETAFLWLIFPQMAAPFAIAFTTHIVLDITNKKSVRLFWPAKKGVSLGLFYADRMANKICAAAGAIWLAATIVISIRK